MTVELKSSVELDRPLSPEYIPPLTLDELSPCSPPNTTKSGILNILLTSTPRMATQGRHTENGESYLGSQTKGGIQSLNSSRISHSAENHGVTKFRGASADEEYEDLRCKLQNQRKLNAELTASNHDLQNQVEYLSHQHRQQKQQLKQLLEQLNEHDTAVRDLRQALTEREHEIYNLNQILERANADMTEFAERTTTMAAELEKQLQKNIEYEDRMDELRNQLTSITKQKDRSQRECTRALEAAEAMQKSIKEFHKRNMEKNQEKEATETQLLMQLKDLEQQLHEASGEITDLREEMRRYEGENSLERDARMAAEQQNVELRMQISQISSKLGGKDSKKSTNSNLERKNAELEAKVAQLRQALDESNQNLSQSDAKLNHILSCQTSDPSDSGLGLSEPPTILHELRERLAERENEVYLLRSRLGNREEYEQDSLSTIQRHSRANSDKLERTVQEMEQLIASLEEERARHTSRLLQLEEQNTEFELRNSSLHAKLQHKIQQADSLQTELQEVNAQMVSMERQVRKTEGECSRLQRHLEDEKQEKTVLQTQRNQLQKQATDQQMQLEQLCNERDMLKKRLSNLEAEFESDQQNYCARWKDSQTTVSELQAELERRDEDLQKTLTDMDKVAQDLNAKEMAIMDMNQELKVARANHQRAVHAIEDKYSLASVQVHELQAELTLCKQQLKELAEQQTTSEEKLHWEIKEKSTKVCELGKDVQKLHESLKERDLRIGELDKQIEKGKGILEKASERLQELDHDNSKLQDQLSSARKQLSTNNNKFEQQMSALKTDLREAQERLASALDTAASNTEDLEAKDKQIENLQRELDNAERESEDLRIQLDEAQADVNQLESQVTQLDDQLSDKRTDLRNHKNQVDQIEAEVDKLKEKLEEKENSIADLEDQLREKSEKLSNIKVELEATRGQHLTESEEIERLRCAIIDKDRQLTSINNKFSALQESVEHKQAELEHCYEILKQQQYQIQQRANQVTQLDLILKKHNDETEQRLTSLESSLNKSQLEANQRTKQVSQLDEQVGLMKAALREKELQLEEASKLSSRQQLQLHSNTDNISQLQEQIQMLKNQLVKVKAENAELQKELEATRGEEQKLQHELTDAKCEASLHLRQSERLNAQLQETLQQCQAQEGNAVCLAEALELVNGQKIQLESRNEAAKRHLQRSVDEIRANYQQQLDNLRHETTQVADRLETDQRQLRNELDQAKETEHQLMLELESTRAELEYYSTAESKQVSKLSAATNQNKGNSSVKSAAKSAIPDYSSRMSAFRTQNPGPAPTQSEPQQPTHSKSTEALNAPITTTQFPKSQFPKSVQDRTQSVLGKFKAPSGSVSDADGIQSCSHLATLSLSDISHAESSSTRYVISEPDDPDSLRAMLREVQKTCSQNISAASGISGKSSTQNGNSRLFGKKVWPNGSTEISKTVTTTKNIKEPKTTKTKMEDLRRNKGPLHSSPQSVRTKSILSKSQNGAKKTVKINNCGSNNTSSTTSNEDHEPTRDGPSQKSKQLPKSPLLPELSPNISTAIAHYDHDSCGEVTLELFAKESSQNSSNSEVYGNDENANNCGLQETIRENMNQDNGALVERRKALAAMQRELENQLQAVNQHLAVTDLSLTT